MYNEYGKVKGKSEYRVQYFFDLLGLYFLTFKSRLSFFFSFYKQTDERIKYVWIRKKIYV